MRHPLIPEALRHWRILRKSLDVRDKRDIAFVYSVEVVVPEDERKLVQRIGGRRSQIEAALYREPPFELPPPGNEPLEHRPVIVGARSVAGHETT